MLKMRAILASRSLIRSSQLRYLSQLVANQPQICNDKMQAWQIHSYGSLEELTLSTVKIPVLTNPSEVLIKVDAASVNPMDVAMISGYGAEVINLLRKLRSCQGKPYSDIEFPLTMGRDFAGTVVATGLAVDKLNIGDEVWGVVPLELQGSHAEYVSVDSCLVNLRPKNLSYIEAASVLYAGLTAWSALWITGGMFYKTTFPTQTNKRVLVLGCTGGVGTVAVQLLKAWNMQVIATCSSDALEMVQNLGADVVIDYKEDDADCKINNEGPYDIILDCSNQGPELVRSKGYPHCSYITLNAPFVRNLDAYGLVRGSLKNFSDLLKYNIPINKNHSIVKWGFFIPSPTGINMLQELIESNKLTPVIQEVIPFCELPSAYKKIADGHARGKVVIDMR